MAVNVVLEITVPLLGYARARPYTIAGEGPHDNTPKKGVLCCDQIGHNCKEKMEELAWLRREKSLQRSALPPGVVVTRNDEPDD